MENPHQTQAPLVQENTNSHSNKNPSLLMLLSGVVLVTAIVAGGIGYYLGSMQKGDSVIPKQAAPISQSPQPENTACTMDAKVCPDGSSVGRSGPNCEFELCPGVNAQITASPTISLNEELNDWKDFNKPSFGITFKYPPNYKVVAEDSTTVELGTDEGSYVTISNQPKEYDESNRCAAETAIFPCVTLGSDEQTSLIMKGKLGEYVTKSFYMEAGGPDNSYHVFIIEGKPRIELRGYIAGGGLDKTFQQIVSTLELK